MSAARWARIRNCAQYASVRSVIKLLKIGRGVVKMALRLKEKYRQEVVPALRKEFNYSNPMQVPTVKKVVVNIGMGEVIQNAKAMEAAVADLAAITGQRPVITRAKRSVAAFKLREGMQIGCMVTLRGPVCVTSRGFPPKPSMVAATIRWDCVNNWSFLRLIMIRLIKCVAWK